MSGFTPGHNTRQALTPKPPEGQKQRKPFIACAIKTEGRGGPFIAGAYVQEHATSPTRFDTLSEWMQAILAKRNRGHIWYVHLGGEYDYKYLIDELLERVDKGATATPMVRGESTVIGWKIRYAKRVYELRDSSSLFNQPLSELAATFTGPGPLLEDNLSTPGTFDPLSPENWLGIRAHVLALRDVLVAADLLLWEQFGVHVRWTAASTALRAYQTTMKRWYYRQRPGVEAFCRDGYFGGICYIRSTRLYQDILSLDVSGMYAAAMRDGVPGGRCMHVHKEYHGFPGFYHVKVRCPLDIPMAFIPVRTEGAQGPLWARGTFETTITSQEMKLAREYGYDFTVIEGYIWERIEHPFNDFVQLCENLEVANTTDGKKNAKAQIVKLLRCTLYGAFGLREEQKEYILSSIYPGDGYAPVIDTYSARFTQIEGLYWRNSKANRPQMNPHWAAWITASARLRLVKLHATIGFDHVYYSDSDSIHVPAAIAAQAIADRRITIGPHYGELKIERDYATFQAIAPKGYYGILQDGSEVNVMKGLPKALITREGMEQAARGEEVKVQYDMVPGTLRLLKRHQRSPVLERVERAYSHIRGSPGWIAEGDRVVPIELRE